MVNVKYSMDFACKSQFINQTMVFHRNSMGFDVKYSRGGGGAGVVPWAGGPPDTSFGFYLRETLPS